MNLNVLLRGQSNAVVLGTLLAPDGRSAVAEAVEHPLGFDGVTNIITILFQ